MVRITELKHCHAPKTRIDLTKTLKKGQTM